MSVVSYLTFHVLDVGKTRFVVPLCHRSVMLDGGMDSVVQFNSLMNGTTANMLCCFFSVYIQYN